MRQSHQHMSAPTSAYSPQQTVFPVSVPEYTISRPDLYLQHPNTSLQSLLSAETSVASPTSSVSSEFEVYNDECSEFYLPTSSPMYAPYNTHFEADWTTFHPSSPIDGSLQFFDSAMLDTTGAPLQGSPIPPAKRQRKSQPEPCPCVYCTPTSNPSSGPAPIGHSHHMNGGAVRRNFTSGGGVMQASPPLQLQFQIDTQPKPIIIGQHGLGADAAFLAQDEQATMGMQGQYDVDTHYYAPY